MSGHVGLREDAQVGHLLAQQIAQLFHLQRITRRANNPARVIRHRGATGG